MSNKFNSNETLNKTPGVCHSHRKDQVQPIQPIPPGEFPNLLNFNIKFIVNLGAGFEDLSGFDLVARKMGPGQRYLTNYIFTPTRLVTSFFLWDPITEELLLFISATNRVTIVTRGTQEFLFLGPDFRPVILNQVALPNSSDIEVARYDVWT